MKIRVSKELDYKIKNKRSGLQRNKIKIKDLGI